MAPDMGNGLEFTLPELAAAPPLPVHMWCDVLSLKGAATVARYTGDYYAGKPAIALNRFGQGRVIYVGTAGDDLLYERLAGWLLGLARVRPLLSTPEGVEAAERWQGDRRLLFLLNHTGRQQEVTLDRCYLHLLDGAKPLEGRATIASRDALVLAEK